MLYLELDFMKLKRMDDYVSFIRKKLRKVSAKLNNGK